MNLEQKKLNNYLKSYRIKKSKIQAIRELIEMYKNDISIQSPDWKKEGHSTNLSNPTVMMAEQIDKLCHKHEMEIKELTTAVIEIERLISLLDGKIAVIFQRRYLLGESVEAVAIKMGYTETNSIYYLINKGLNKILSKK